MQRQHPLMCHLARCSVVFFAVKCEIDGEANLRNGYSNERPEPRRVKTRQRFQFFLTSTNPLQMMDHKDVKLYWQARNNKLQQIHYA